MSREKIIGGESGGDRIIAPQQITETEERNNLALRPEKIAEYTGQADTIKKLKIAIQAAKNRNEPLEHILLDGPPGLGKTTLAHIIATEMGGNIIVSSGPSLTRAGDLMGILSTLQEGDVLFIDEIHRLGTAVEEFIYPAMEDYKVDFVIDKGAYAKTINIPLKRFTLIGATTRSGQLSAPLRNRFGLNYHLEFYPEKELKEILKRAAYLLNTEIDDKSLSEIAKRARGTPRICNRILRRVRDFADVEGNGIIDISNAIKAIELEGIDEEGLDTLDRKYLKIIINNYKGGPVGVDAIAATLSEETTTIEDVVEPYLLISGFVNRTKSGRRATDKAYNHLGIAPII